MKGKGKESDILAFTAFKVMTSHEYKEQNDTEDEKGSERELRTSLAKGVCEIPVASGDKVHMKKGMKTETHHEGGPRSKCPTRSWHLKHRKRPGTKACLRIMKGIEPKSHRGIENRELKTEMLIRG